MPAVITPHHPRHYTSARTSVQKVCIGMGIVFIVAGLTGIIMPGLMGMHLSMAHNLIHLISGAISLWVGYSDVPRRAYNFCLAFGVVYGLLGLVGFVLGQPGYPGVGHMEADQNLLRVIPNVLEFGSSDHIVHVLIAAILLSSAYGWKKRYGSSEHSVAKTDLSRADLGKSDVDRTSDVNRRRDFEGRV